ncbi:MULTISPECIES: M48 family metallopeptidase [Inquilinus]|uniref:Zn-dependent protease n=1 Tax=Inquilinus ginsengisoli TaxID=363840 RepID=A0ABU1JH75_9PROT|nr:M48 family metallopeptidase [Inquilinus ginsengisoli]MDR6287977.1 putative Zn-dependent protease [Inquilinus ginsengisoli]
MIDSWNPILRRRGFLAGAGTSLAALALSGCQTLQNYANDPLSAMNTANELFTSKKISPGEELGMGDGLYPRLIAASGGSYSNARVQSAVRRFAEPIFRTSKRQFRWEITVLDDNTPNAWSLPGGKLGINKGMLRYVATETELAAVISHEMGHAELSHQIQELDDKGRLDKILSFGKGVAQTEISASAGSLSGVVEPLSKAALDELQGPITDLITSGYSRDHERQADAYILAVFRTTGYDPRQASAVFKTLDSLVPPGEDKTTSLFSSHPDTRERIELLDAAAAKQPAGGGGGGGAEFEQIKAVFPTRRYYLRNPAEAS